MHDSQVGAPLRPFFILFARERERELGDAAAAVGQRES